MGSVKKKKNPKIKPCYFPITTNTNSVGEGFVLYLFSILCPLTAQNDIPGPLCVAVIQTSHFKRFFNHSHPFKINVYWPEEEIRRLSVTWFHHISFFLFFLRTIAVSFFRLPIWWVVQFHALVFRQWVQRLYHVVMFNIQPCFPIMQLPLVEFSICECLICIQNGNFIDFHVHMYTYWVQFLPNIFSYVCHLLFGVLLETPQRCCGSGDN